MTFSRNLFVLALVVLTPALFSACGSNKTTNEETTARSETERSEQTQIDLPKEEPLPGDRKVVTINGVEFAFRWCPAGEFMMGSPDFYEERYANEKLHRVVLKEGFWIMETEVSHRQWKAVMENVPSDFEEDDFPVENVSWNDCQTFCRKANLKLPTEAQWEYACRAGNSDMFSEIWNGEAWSTADTDITNYLVSKTQEVQTLDGEMVEIPVGTRYNNVWNVCKMQTNIWEWCEDCYSDFFTEETSLQNEKSDSSFISPKEKKIIQALNELTTFKFDYAPLEDVIAEIKDVHHIEVQLDEPAFRDEMIPPEEVGFVFNMSGVTLRSALNRMLKNGDLSFIIEDECLLITTKTKADETFHNSEHLRQLFISMDNSVINQHEEQLMQLLKKNVSFNFADEPLPNVINSISQLYKLEIQIDYPALRDEMIDPEELLVNLNISDVSLRSALNRMLAGWDLTFVIVDECILITTKNEKFQKYVMPDSHRDGNLEYPMDDSSSSQYRVIRGGGWDVVDRIYRPTIRDCSLPQKVYDDVGFRCVLPQ
ncbi:MAG: SUMF1/EgtB/PvdO family nonheme iron enzyme [Thermoguttaceae bacterium]|nr:SUMF1/EgtB/PvdO family nonheme iron enzyme [Thermoguttaceae bacterium]